MDENEKNDETTQAQGGRTGFDALDVAHDFVEAVAPAIVRIRAADRSLADQARRAAQSVALNIAEGRKRCGRDRLQAFRVASGSGEEVRSALRIARAWGYVSAEALETPLGLLDRVMAMTWRLGRG